ncbi:helix-turn-helix domain-containing protein [Shinella sp. M31]|uniref:helix-turn-helix domain-containing protein n=1 Tax=Shinella sp. M31 TaxID=3368615 RepID=UPI003B9F3B75
MTKGKFPNGLRKAMDVKGVGLTDLAKLVGTSKQNIERWANGERALKPEMAAKLAPLVDATAAQLLLLPIEEGAATPSQPQPDKDAIMKEAAAQNLRSALIAYGAPAKQVKALLALIDARLKTTTTASPERTDSRDQSRPASRRREEAP